MQIESAEYIKKMMTHDVLHYLSDKYQNLADKRPYELLSKVSQLEGPKLHVGGGVGSMGYGQYGGDNWETLDPYCPEEVTYRLSLKDVPSIPELKEKFVFITCCSVFEHIPTIDLVPSAKGLLYLLKPGGSLYFEIPYIWAYHPSVQYNFGGDFNRLSHEGVISLFPELSVTYCDYCVPKECPDGIGVAAIFYKA